MPQFDPRQVLDPLTVDKSIKHDAWDAYQASQSPDDFKARFDKLNIPREAKRALWDAKFGGPTTAQPSGAGQRPPVPKGTWVDTLEERALDVLYPTTKADPNPIGIGALRGVMSLAPFAQAHPALENIMTPTQQRLHPILTGSAQLLGGLISPENTVLAGGLGAVSGLAGDVMGAGFGTQMVAGGIKAQRASRAAAAMGDKSEAERLQTVAAGQIALGGLAGVTRIAKDVGDLQPTIIPPVAPPPTAGALRPGAPPQAPMPEAPIVQDPVARAFAQPRTIDVQAKPVMESPAIAAARAKTATMQARMLRGEITPEEYQTWFRTGKEPGTSAPAQPPTPTLSHQAAEVRAMQEENYAALSRKADSRGVPIGGTEEFLAGPSLKSQPPVEPPVGPPPIDEENLPRALGQTIRAKLPNPERVTSTGFVIPIPPERTTGVHDAAIKAGGAIPGGIQPPVPEAGLPEYAYFHDPESGSSLMLPTDKITADSVREQLEKSRAQYAEARARAAAPKTLIDRVAEPVEPRTAEPEAILLPEKAAPAKSQIPLDVAQTRFDTALARANKVRKEPDPNAVEQSRANMGEAFRALGRASVGKEEETAQRIEQPIPALQSAIAEHQEKDSYLEKHITQRADIIQKTQDIYNITAAGREKTLTETGKRTPPIPGISHAAREGLAKLLGNRRVNVLDVLAKIPEESLPPAIIEARDLLEEVKEGFASGSMSSEAVDESISQSKVLESLVSDFLRPAVKTHGHPTLQAVAEAQGVPVEQLTETGAGKAISIHHGGALPVMTQAIWENDFGGAKGKFSPAPEFRPPDSKKGPFKEGEFEALEAKKLAMLQAKRTELQATIKGFETEIKQRQFFAKTLRDRITQRGSIDPALLKFGARAGAGAVVGSAVGGPVGAAIGATIAVAPELARTLHSLANQAGIDTEGLHDWARKYLNGISPDPRVANPVFDYANEVLKQDHYARNAVNAHLHDWFSRPHSETLAFTDAVKRGELTNLSQSHREFVESIVRPLEDNIHQRMNDAIRDHATLMGHEFSPVAYLENHDRVMWKGPTDKVDAVWNRSRSTAGSKGMLKPHTLEDMSEGIAAGLTPWTWNPVENFLMAWHDSFKFIEDLKMVDHFIAQGRTGGPGFVYVKTGGDTTGLFKVAGSNYERYFHVPQGLVKAGEWYANDKSLATMLNNYTSVDKIRGSMLGRMYLGWRAAFGSWRLFGLFHTYAMTQVATAQGMTGGVRGVALGIQGSDLGKVIDGLKQVGMAPAAGIRNAMIGKELQAADAKAGFNPDAFWQSDAGEAFNRIYPNARELLEHIWKAGGRNMFRLDEILQNRATDKLHQALAEVSDAYARGNNLRTVAQSGKAAALAIPAMMHTATAPVFEYWIPALKLGTTFQALSQAFEENAADIAAGSITKEEIARREVNRIEDWFGEMNMDNLFINNTMRTLLQLYYRSFSWRFGTARSAYHALRGSGPDVASWANLLLMTTLGSMLVHWLMTKKRPEAKLVNAVAPGTGVLDDRGKELRLVWPNYTRDIMSASHNPFGYISGGQSDLFTSMLEAYHNKDFYGKYIVKPSDANEIGGLAWRFAHAVVPFDGFLRDPSLANLMSDTFMGRNVNQLTTEGLSKAKAWGAIAAGLSPAMRSTGLSPAEQELQRLTSVNYNAGPMSEAQYQRVQAMHEIESAARNQKDYSGIIQKYEQSGVLNRKDALNALQKANRSYLQNGIESRYISLEDSLKVFEKGTPEEQREMFPYVAEKLKTLRSERDPKERERVRDLYNRDVQAAFSH